MELTYENLRFELPANGLIQVEAFEYRAELGQHAVAAMTILVEEDTIPQTINELSDGAVMAFWEEDQRIFHGKILTFYTVREKALNYLCLTAVSHTYDWDLEVKSRSFTDLESTYEAVLKQVLADYEKSDLFDCVTKGTVLLDWLLQYEESDWAFLHRLSSHFGTYLIPDTTADYGRVFFGIPELDHQVELEEQEYSMEKDMEQYYRLSYLEEFFPQETIRWFIRTERTLSLGETVKINRVKAVIRWVQYRIEQGTVKKQYIAAREKGLIHLFRHNPVIYGMSLPAEVREVRGSQVRVQFAIDPGYEGRPGTRWFPFAIESSNLFCMPEVGSQVHIYFPSQYENQAMAVHAIRMKAGQKPQQHHAPIYAQEPDQKSFTGPNGGGLGWHPEAAGVYSDAEGKALLSLDNGEDPGSVNLFGSSLELMIGGSLVIEDCQGAVLFGNDSLTLSLGTGASSQIVLNAKELVKLITDRLDLVTKQYDFVLPETTSTELMQSVTANDFELRESSKMAVAAGIASHKAVLYQRFADGADLITLLVSDLILGAILTKMGMVHLGGPKLAKAAKILATVGKGVVGAMAYEDASAATGANRLANRGIISDGSHAFRDGLFDGSQENYEKARSIVGGAYLLATSVSRMGLSSGGKAITICGTKISVSVVAHGAVYGARGAVSDYMKYGEVNFATLTVNVGLGMFQGLAGNYLGQAMRQWAGLRGLGAVGQFFSAWGAETLFDTFFEFGLSQIYGTEFDVIQSLIWNGAINGFGYFAGEPVDMAHGGYYYLTTDLLFADLNGAVELTRQYFSTSKHSGMFGRGWQFPYDSRICFDAEQKLLHLQAVTGHRLAFAWQEEEWMLVTKGCRRFQLKQRLHAGGFDLYDHQDFTTYHYNGEGRLVEIRDQNDQKTTLLYEDGMLQTLTTPLGRTITFVCQKGRVVELRDHSGRSMKYRYEGDLLTQVLHVDEGMTQYEYEEHGYLCQVRNQEGETYLKNFYDRDGRVLRQELSNGEHYEFTYDPSRQCNTVFYSGLDREDVYEYNRSYLPVRITEKDGSVTTFAYNEQNEKIREVDRMGAGTEWEYGAYGQVIREQHSDGYEKWYNYDDFGHLVQESDNEGSEIIYTYDLRHNRTGEQRKLAKGIWSSITYDYDSRGRLIQKTDGNGGKTRYAYQPDQGGATQYVTPEEEVFGYEYDELGRPVTIRSRYGEVELGYNARNFVVSRRDGEGHQSQTMYDKMGNLIAYYTPKLWSEKDRLISYRFTYDFMQKRLETVTPEGSHYRVVRNGEGDILTEYHPNGFAYGRDDTPGIKREYDQEHRCIRIDHLDGGCERFFYDREGRVIKHVTPEYYQKDIDNGIGYQYRYDLRGRLLEVINPDGAWERRYAYNGRGLVTEEEQAGGTQIRYRYNLAGWRIEKWERVCEAEGQAYGRVTRYDYDQEGNKIRESHGVEEVLWGKEPTSFHRLHFAYDKCNRLIQVKDEYGAVMDYAYDCLGNCTYEAKTIEAGIVNRIHRRYNKSGWLVEEQEEIAGNGEIRLAVTRYGYDANGNVTEVKTPNGHLIKRMYDKNDRLIQERVLDRPHGIDRQTRYQYDKAGNVTAVEVSGAGMEPSTITYHYDWKDRLVREELPGGALHLYQYDQNDRLIGEKKPEYVETNLAAYGYDNRGNQTRMENGLGQLIREDRYGVHQKLEERRIAGSKTVRLRYTEDLQIQEILTGKSNEESRSAQQYQYNARGQMIGLVDGNQNETHYELDAWGRLTKVLAPNGREECYRYNEAGQITSTVDGNGNEIQYKYNGFGLVREIIDQEGLREEFYYDGERNLILQIDRNGTRTERHYTVDGAIAFERATTKDGRIVTNRYEYDARGRLVKAVNDGFVYTYDYDQNGRLAEKRSGGKRLISYEYNEAGQIVWMQGANGCGTRYRYDELGRTQAVLDEGETVVAHYTYEADDQIQTIRYGDGAVTRYLYDETGNISRLVTEVKGEPFFDFQYQYDGNGNQVQKTGFQPSLSGRQTEQMVISYGYDEVGQLIREEINGRTVGYGYDLAGNRIWKEGEKGKEGYTYNQKNQLIERRSQDQLLTYQYDPQGNLIQETGSGVSYYSYDPFNRQSKVVKPDKQVQENRYDPEGLRAEMLENGKLARFVFHRKELISELDEKDQLVEFYQRGHGVEGILQDQKHTCVLKDEHRSTIFILDQDHEIKNQYRYNAFGVMEEKKELIANRILYTGQQYDGVAEQYYLRARYYNPVIGRFLQEDVYHGDGLNLYAYCGNNPVAYYDPSGYSKDPGKYISGGTTEGPGKIDIDPHKLKSQGDLSKEYFDGLTNNGTITGGGRSGGTKPPTSTPNSYYITDKGHVIIYDSNGQRVMDISKTRIKIETYNISPYDSTKGSWSSYKLKDSSGMIDSTAQWILDYFGL